MDESEIIDENLLKIEDRRRKLLPGWIKVFVWIFMIFGVIVPFGLLIGLMGIDFNLSIYGLETSKPVSGLGLLITLIFAFKGIISFGLWTEKYWAVKLASIDAIIGIIVCCIVMLLLPFLFKENGFSWNLRLELIVLIPYLIKMRNIKEDWQSRG